MLEWVVRLEFDLHNDSDSVTSSRDSASSIDLDSDH